MNWGIPGQIAIQRVRSSAIRAALGCALAGLAWAAPANAETIAGTGTTGAVIVEPGSIVKVDDMNFALVAPRTTAGSIVLNPATNACTSPDGMARSGACQAASFAGMGRRNFFVRITYPTTITLTGPGTAMTVDTITLDTSPDLVFSPPGNGNGNGNGNRRYRITSVGGIYDFRMGGTLRVNPNQAPGIYTGTYSVSVQYN